MGRGQARVGRIHRRRREPGLRRRPDRLLAGGRPVRAADSILIFANFDNSFEMFRVSITLAKFSVIFVFKPFCCGPFRTLHWLFCRPARVACALRVPCARRVLIGAHLRSAAVFTRVPKLGLQVLRAARRQLVERDQPDGAAARAPARARGGGTATSTSFRAVSRTFVGPVPPHARHALHSTWCPS